MQILILDRFDVIKPPECKKHVEELSKYMLHSSKHLHESDAVVYLSFDLYNKRNFNYNVVYCAYHIDELCEHLSNIFERYAYLYDLSLSTGINYVPFDLKIYVGSELVKNNTPNFNYSLTGTWRHHARYYWNKKLSKFLNYKFYFIIMDTWEKFWMGVLGCVIGAFLVMVLSLTLSNKKTIRYELGNNHNIEKIIDNAADESVMDITNMPPERVLHLIDSLNATLLKYPDNRK